MNFKEEILYLKYNTISIILLVILKVIKNIGIKIKEFLYL